MSDTLETTVPPYGRRWFLSAVGRYKGVICLILIATFTIKMLALVPPFAFQAVIDRVLVTDGLSTLKVIMAALVLAAVIDAALGALRAYLLYHTATRINAVLIYRVFDHLLHLPIRWFQRWKTGEVVSRLAEVNQIVGFMSSNIVSVVFDSLFIVVFLVVLTVMEPALSVIVLVTIPVLLALYLTLGPPMRARTQDAFMARARYQSTLVETLSGVETVKGGAYERIFRQSLENQVADSYRQKLRVKSLAIFTSEITDMVTRLASAMILFVGAIFIIEGTMTLGELIAFNMITDRVIGPVLRLTTLWEDVQQMRVSFARLGDVMETEREDGGRHAISYNDHSRRREATSGLTPSLAFNDVTFSYAPGDNGQPTIDDISFHIPPGETVGLIGRSGSGKTTLVKLIPLLLRPNAGQVLLDGRDACVYRLGQVRRRICYVPQHAALFSGRLYDALKMGNDAVSQDRILEICACLGADEAIASLPGGYDSDLREGGVGLSGGQRQRMALARALLSPADIIILDEATSALDSTSERVIFEALPALLSGRTLIAISHRVEMLHKMDRIIALGDGKIIYDGDHAGLKRLPHGLAHRPQVVPA